MEITKEKLEEMYFKKNMSGIEISKYFGKSSSTIYNKMDEFGINRKDKSLCQKPLNISKKTLNEMYYNKNMSLSEIASEYSCNAETIRRLMINYDIKRKPKTWKCKFWNKGNKTPEKTKDKMSKVRKEMYEKGEIKHWNDGGEWDDNVKDKISKTLTGRYRGDKNPNWKGGANTETQVIRRRVHGSRKYKQWRNYVFKRDKYSCQMCGKKSKGDIEAHHIITVESNADKIVEKDNGITLCIACHRSIKNKESEYIDFFKEVVFENKKI